MKTYGIRRVEGKTDWSDIPVLAIDEAQEKSAPDVHAFGQIAYGKSALYVHLWAEEPHIRAEITSPYDEPCEDSCLEFFFCPEEGNPAYFNIEFNPNGVMYLGIGTGLHDLLRLVPDYTDRLFSPSITRTQTGWSLEYGIPFAFIRRFFPAFSAQSGKTIRANCYKCGNKTVQPHYLEWNPMPHRPLTFHWPEEFGLMRFE